MDFLTAFILGLVGSLHCAGMCGPLALALPSSGHSTSSFVVGRLAYNLGRIATYCALGLVFGLIGRSLYLAGLQRWVSMVLGALLLAGLFGSRRLALWSPVTAFVNSVKSRMSSLLHERTLIALAVLGLLNGLLPCGLVYVACAGATATHGIISGVGYMASFGAGTVPMLLAIGLGGRFVSVGLRLRLRKMIPISIVVLASLLILRGMSLGVPFVSPDLSAGTSCCQK